MGNISIEQLTTEQKQLLFKELQKEEKAKADKIKEERTNYKKLVDEIIPLSFMKLVQLSEQIAKVKAEVFGDLQALVALKSDVFGRDIEQQTHTFTSTCGKTISIGWRLNDGWDDTVGAGLQKMNDLLASKVQNDESRFFYNLLMKKLKMDAKGQLRASTVMSLKKEIDAYGDVELIDAINIIIDAYLPKRSKEFLTCKYRVEKGDYQDLALDITSASIDNPLNDLIHKPIYDTKD